MELHADILPPENITTIALITAYNYILPNACSVASCVAPASNVARARLAPQAQS